MATNNHDDIEYLLGLTDLSGNSINRYRTFLRDFAKWVGDNTEYGTFQQALNNDQAIDACSKDLKTSKPTSAARLGLAARTVRLPNQNPAAATKLKECYRRIDGLLPSGLSIDTNGRHKGSLKALAEWAMNCTIYGTFDDILDEFRKGNHLPVNECIKHLEREERPTAAQNLLRAVQRVTDANPRQLHISNTHFDPVTTEQLQSLHAHIDGLQATSDLSNASNDNLHLALTAFANWAGENSEHGSVKETLNATGPVEEDLTVKACLRHLQASDQVVAADYLIPVVKALRENPDVALLFGNVYGYIDRLLAKALLCCKTALYELAEMVELDPEAPPFQQIVTERADAAVDEVLTHCQMSLTENKQYTAATYLVTAVNAVRNVNKSSDPA